MITSFGIQGPWFFVTENASLTSPFGAAKFVVENNLIGMHVEQGASAIISGEMNVKNNAIAGIKADNASGLTFLSVPANASTILYNGTDMILGFGTKSTIDGVTVGTIGCDGTVLSGGTKVCP